MRVGVRAHDEWRLRSPFASSAEPRGSAEHTLRNADLVEALLWTTMTKGKSLRFSLLIFLAVNLLLVLVASIVLLGVPLLDKNGSLCLTEQCINTATRVITAMDRSADPCVDFYQYACGGWMKANPVPDWTATWDRLALLRESVVQDMRQLLESRKNFNKSDITEPAGIDKARSLYRSCMDTEKLEQTGLEPLWQIFTFLNISQNPLSIDERNDFDWIHSIAKAKRFLGINILFGFSVTVDVRNSSLNKIVIEQIPPGFGAKYFLHLKKFVTELKHYRNHMTVMLKAYTNGSVDESFADDIIEFSTQIAKVMTPPEIRRNPSHIFHEVTLQQLVSGPASKNTSWNMVNWTRYLEIVFSDTDMELDFSNDTAILLDLPYMQKLANLLRNVKKGTLERFIWWNIFSTLAPLTLTKFRTLAFDFSQQLYGLQTEIPRWKKCTNNVNLNFGLVLSFLYIRSNFDKGRRNEVLEMLEDIKYAFKITVQDLHWMDYATREKTLTKLHAIRAFVGYPGWIMNATQLDKHYRNINVIDGDYFGTFLSLTNSIVKGQLERLRKKPNKNRWVSVATAVNAFYSATLNSVTFPAGILKPPFYDNGIPALDYASIGAIMGHEITHGFDDQGRRYDEFGNLKQWWSLATLKHYHEKVQCIINQYNNYWIPDLGPLYRVDGFNTQGENIADNGGLRAAYEAYKHRKQKSAIMNQRLPGLLDITTDQLFFLGFAQIWCGNSTLGALKNKLVEGVHSPNRVRVIGTLSNTEEFAAIWKCPEGSPMNPRNKCVLW